MDHVSIFISYLILVFREKHTKIIYDGPTCVRRDIGTGNSSPASRDRVLYLL